MDTAPSTVSFLALAALLFVQLPVLLLASFRAIAFAFAFVASLENATPFFYLAALGTLTIAGRGSFRHVHSLPSVVSRSQLGSMIVEALHFAYILHHVYNVLFGRFLENFRKLGKSVAYTEIPVFLDKCDFLFG